MSNGFEWENPQGGNSANNDLQWQPAPPATPAWDQSSQPATPSWQQPVAPEASQPATPPPAAPPSWEQQAAREGMTFDPRNGTLVGGEGSPVYEQKLDKGEAIGFDPRIHDIEIKDIKFTNGEEERPSVHLGGEHPSIDGFHLDDILKVAIDKKASDIHITAGLPPMCRLDGEIIPLPFAMLTPDDTRRLMYETMTDEQVQKFEQTHELDFGYSAKGLGRFRSNVYMQRAAVAAALRAIPTKIPSFEQLNLPGIIRELSVRTSGLILVTGPTGSGKSTTIATMIDDINENRQNHILTIEDPIEYLHKHKKSMVNQRELHADTFSFHSAIRAVLREDPDIILVGELRDLETIEAALSLAETGHLVFGTLHTRNAPATVDRIIDVFPTDQQDQIRVLLGNTLEAVISQQLLPKINGGRIAAIEIMIANNAIRNLIREGKTHQMYSIIETNSASGMITMDKSLATIFRSGAATFEECVMRAVDKETFVRNTKG